MPLLKVPTGQLRHSEMLKILAPPNLPRGHSILVLHGKNAEGPVERRDVSSKSPLALRHFPRPYIPLLVSKIKAPGHAMHRKSPETGAKRGSSHEAHVILEPLTFMICCPVEQPWGGLLLTILVSSSVRRVELYISCV